MADYLTTDTELTSVADAIRTKGGTSASLMYPAGFVSAIQAIPSGGGTWADISSSFTFTDGEESFDISALTDGSIVLFLATKTSTQHDNSDNPEYVLSILNSSYYVYGNWESGAGSLAVYDLDNCQINDAAVYVSNNEFLLSPATPYTIGTTIAVSGAWPII